MIHIEIIYFFSIDHNGEDRRRVLFWFWGSQIETYPILVLEHLYLGFERNKVIYFSRSFPQYQWLTLLGFSLWPWTCPVSCKLRMRLQHLQSSKECHHDIRSQYCSLSRILNHQLSITFRDDPRCLRNDLIDPLALLSHLDSLPFATDSGTYINWIAYPCVVQCPFDHRHQQSTRSSGWGRSLCTAWTC